MTTSIPPNRASFDARAVAEVTGGRVVAQRGLRVASGITTDSRRVTPGAAFVALRGSQHDGHDYVRAAVDAGAIVLVVETGHEPRDVDGADVVSVADTLTAWGALGKAHLRRWRAATPEARLVAITGSAGKTTTKEFCAALLRTVASCHATAGNLNNRVGLPAMALAVEPSARFVVLEMGMSVPGEISALSEIAEPDVGLVTNVGFAHALGVGGTIEHVAHEKGALFEGVRPGGTMVANSDDAAVMSQLRRNRSARVVTFGSGDDADYRLGSRESLGALGSRVFVRRRGATASFVVPIPGRAAAIDFVAALAAAEAAAGRPLPDAGIASALASVTSQPGRAQIRTLAGGLVLLDDSYNASPATMDAALATLGEIGQGRRIAVLGEMKELGPAAVEQHRRLGRAVADAGVALLVTCGGLADTVADEAERLGVDVVRGRDAADASRIATERVRPGDAVLVKASRSVGAERVAEALVAMHGEEPR